MILSLFAWAKISKTRPTVPWKNHYFEEKPKKEQNISFILFCKRGIKDYLWDSLDHRKPRSKKFANFTTTRLRWNSYKFLGTISYEISWSTNKTSFYTRKICIFSVDLTQKWGTRAIRGQTAGLEVSEVWQLHTSTQKRVDNSHSCSWDMKTPSEMRLISSRCPTISSSWMISQQLAPNLQGC